MPRRTVIKILRRLRSAIPGPPGATREDTGPVHVNHGFGVQVNAAGVNTQTNYLSSVKKAPGPAALAAPMIVILAIVAVLLYVRPWAATPEFQLVSYGVGTPGAISGTETVEPDIVRPAKVPVTPVDITVKNSGGAPAVVIAAVVEVRFAETLSACLGIGGPVKVAADYQIPLPADRPAPFAVRQEIEPFEVEPHDVERFTLTIGPDVDHPASGGAALYVADISLEVDSLDDPVAVGPAAWVTQSGDGYANVDRMLGGGHDEECLRENSRTVARFGGIEAKRSEEAAALIRRWGNLTGADGKVLTPACRPSDDVPDIISESSPVRISGYCVVYTRKMLAVHMNFTVLDKIGEHFAVIRLLPRYGTGYTTIACRTTDRDGSSREVEFAAPTASEAEIQPCSDQQSDSVTLYAFPGKPLVDSPMLIEIELLPAKGKYLDFRALPPITGRKSIVVHLMA
ncbi:hypothetical protein ACFY36_31165 [Actinoplanes sp. NPDC000266]